MDSDISRWIITLLLSIIGFLIAAGYKAIIERMTSFEKKQAAFLIALLFIVTHAQPPPPREVLDALEKAVR